MDSLSLEFLQKLCLGSFAALVLYVNISEVGTVKTKWERGKNVSNPLLIRTWEAKNIY